MLLKLVLFAIVKKVLRIVLKKYSECEVCTMKRVQKRYYNNKDDTLPQR